MKKVRNERLRRVIALILIAVFVFMEAPQYKAEASDGVKYDVADYKGSRDKADWKYPTKKGKVFAGWYTDSTYATAYQGTTGEAYAKFVDANVLSVKKQLKSGTKSTSSTTDIRFITSIDTLLFSDVGFEIEVNCTPEKDFNLVEKKAYTSILVDGVKQPFTASAVFGTDEATYFVMHSITGIPNAVFTNTFTVNPYWHTLDGTKVYGETKSFTIDALINSPADVWYASGTQKIRPDVAAEEYADVQMSGLNVKTGHLEYESAQIIMTANRDIQDYNLIVNDLTLNGNSAVKFSAENIRVFNQRYIYCDNRYGDGVFSTAGEYPDALIPFKEAKQYKENKAVQGKNQGIWVTFHSPKGQQAGEYSGSFTLEMDGYVQNVPVNLKVWDYDFAGNYTAESCFLIEWNAFSYAELDSSQDMYDAYAEALLDYRLQPGLLMNDIANSDAEDIAYYTKKAFDLAQDERCTVVFLPFDYDHTRGDTYLVKETMKNWIRSFVDISLESYGTEEQLNMVEKTMMYLTIVDEPTMNDGALIPRLNYVTEQFATCRSEVHDEYLATLGNKETSGLTDKEYNFRLEVINAIDDISNIVTSEHDERITADVEVYCPQIDKYHEEDDRAQYANDKERWWYTCVGPWPPYPTYHINDSNSLISSRLMSWMQSDYDVIGNLYWATNLYNNYAENEFIEDPYTECSERYEGANGDGYLFYPGKRYGVEGPIGTVRLQAIRDGLEEYETLQAIKSIYQGIGVNFQNVYEGIAKNMYSGTKVEGTTQIEFDLAREQIGNIAELASMGGAVSSINIETLAGWKTATVQLVVPSNYTITYDGTMSQEQKGDYTHYTFTKNIGCSTDLYTFKCTVSNEAKSISLNLYLSGDAEEYLNSTLSGVDTYGAKTVVSTTASVAENAGQNTETANLQNLSPIASDTDILLYDFEDYDRNFQLMRVMSYFGAVKVNTETQYVKNGNVSALLQPLGYHSTMLNNPRTTSPESCLYVPFTSETYDFDYSDSAKIREIDFSIYNGEEESVSVYVGLIYDKHAQEVSEPIEFVLEPGWNEVTYTLDHNILAINYDLSACYGMALSFDRVGSRELKEAPQLYLDDIWLKLNESAVTPEDVIVLDDNEICDFEKSYQEYVVKSESYDKALRPDLDIVMASDYGLQAISGDKVLRAVLKPTDCIDGTIYDSIYFAQSLMDKIDFSEVSDEDRICFDIYNDSNTTFDFSVQFVAKDNSTYVKHLQAKAGEWTTVEIFFKEINFAESVAEIRILWSEFLGSKKVIYFDDFRIETKISDTTGPNTESGWGPIS